MPFLLSILYFRSETLQIQDKCFRHDSYTTQHPFRKQRESESGREAKKKGKEKGKKEKGKKWEAQRGRK